MRERQKPEDHKVVEREEEGRETVDRNDQELRKRGRRKAVEDVESEKNKDLKRK